MGAQELFQEAQLLFIEGKEKESIEAFTKAIEAGADAYTAHLSRGVAYLKTKETDKAIQDFDKALGVNDKSARGYYYRGMVHMVRDDFERAVSDFTKALQYKSALAPAKFARATAYARMGKFDEAATDLRAVIPQMEANVQQFVDSYGIVRTEMWKVMAQLTGEGPRPGLELSEDEVGTLKKWLAEE